MLLLDRQGAKTDAFTRIASAQEAVGAATGAAVLAPFSELDALLAADTGARLGALIENTQNIEALTRYFDRLALIAIAFPSSGDGRGFSLARQIRRLGFTGVLRASGPLFSDQFPQALACGFTEVEIPDANAARQPVEHWLAAANRVSLTYQRDFSDAENIFDLRQARKAKAEKNV